MTLKHHHLDALQPTPEMIATPMYLDWTDEQLGQMVRAIALDICDTYGALSARLAACAAIIHGEMAEGKLSRIAWSENTSGEVIEVRLFPPERENT
jgi:hypothetical protein